MNRQDINGLLKKIRYFGFFTPISHLCISLGGERIPLNIRKGLISKRNKKIRDFLLPFINNSNLNISKSKDIVNVPEANKVVWFFWLQGAENLTPISKLCLESIRHYANGNRVILLTKNNLNEYVNIHSIVYQRFHEGNLKAAHFADIVRINLLAQRGGLWLDATMLLTKPLPDNIFNGEFWTVKIPEFGDFISKCRWSVFALAAKPGNPLFLALSKIFEVYLEKYPVLLDYFMFDQLINLLYETNPEIKEMIDQVPVNNPDVHKLNPILNKEFNELELKILTKDTYLFKLSNKTYPPSFPFSPSTYFSHLLHHLS